MLHPIWLNFYDQNLEDEYQKEKFVYVLRHYYTFGSILITACVTTTVYFAALDQYIYSMYCSIMLTLLGLEILAVKKVNPKLCQVFIFKSNFIASILPEIYYLSGVTDPYFYSPQSAYLEGSCIMLLQYCLLVQPKFIVNAIQIVLLVAGKVFIGFISDFNLNILVLIILGIFSIYAFYQQDKSQREMFNYKKNQTGFNQLINDTIDRPIIVIEFDHEALLFKLVSSNKSASLQFGISDDKNLRVQLRAFKVNLKTSVEDWIFTNLNHNEGKCARQQIQVFNILKPCQYQIHMQQLSIKPNIYALIFLKIAEQQIQKKYQLLNESIEYILQRNKQLQRAKQNRVLILQDMIFACKTVQITLERPLKFKPDSCNLYDFLSKILGSRLKTNKFKIEGIKSIYITTDLKLLWYIFRTISRIHQSSKIFQSSHLIKYSLSSLQNRTEEQYNLISFTISYDVHQSEDSCIQKLPTDFIKISRHRFIEFFSIKKILKNIGPGDDLKFRVRQISQSISQINIYFSILQNMDMILLKQNLIQVL